MYLLRGTPEADRCDADRNSLLCVGEPGRKPDACLDAGGVIFPTSFLHEIPDIRVLAV